MQKPTIAVSSEIKKLSSQRPSVGLKRILTFLFTFSAATVLFLYIYIVINAFLGNPPYAKQSGNALNFIFEYGITGATYIWIFAHILQAILPIKRHTKSLFGLVLLSNDPKSPYITSRQWIIRNLSYALLLLIVTILRIPEILSAFTYFILQLITSLSAIKFNPELLNNPDSIEKFTDSFLYHNPLYVAISFILPVLFFYFIFVKTRNDRGIHDLLAGTKVVEGYDAHKTSFVVTRAIIIVILLALAYPTGQYLEYRFPRSEGSFNLAISAKRQKEYRHNSGWSVLYDPVAIRVNDKDSQNMVTFYVKDIPNSCIQTFQVYEFQENPQNLPIADFLIWLKETKNWEVITEKENQTIDKIFMNGYETWKVTYTSPSLQPLTSENKLNLVKKIRYYINANGKIYELMYEIYETEYSKEHITAKECNHTETEISKMIETFKIKN